MAFFIYCCILLGRFIILILNISNLKIYTTLFLILVYFSLILPLPNFIFFFTNFNFLKYKLSQNIKVLLSYITNLKNQLYEFIVNILIKIFLTYLFIIALFINTIKAIYNLPFIIMIFTLYTVIRLSHMVFSFYIPYLIYFSMNYLLPFIINYIFPGIVLMIFNIIHFIIYCISNFTIFEELLDLSTNNLIINLLFDLIYYIINLFISFFNIFSLKFSDNIFNIFYFLKNFYLINFDSNIQANILYNFDNISQINNFMDNNILDNIYNLANNNSEVNDNFQDNNNNNNNNTNNNFMDIDIDPNLLTNNNLDLSTILNLVNSNINNINEDIINFNNDSNNIITNFRFRVSRYIINFQITDLGSNFRNNPFNLGDSNERFSLLRTQNNFKSHYNSILNPLNVLTPVHFNNNNIINLDTYSIESQFNYYRNILVHNNLQNFLSTSIANSSNINNISNVVSTSVINLISESNLTNISNATSISNVTNINNSLNISDITDRGEGPSNLSISTIKPELEFPSFIQDVEMDALIAANYDLYFGEDTNMTEIFTIAGGTNSNYLGGVDVYGNIHLNADILNDPTFNIVANLVPGVDFIEGFDSFVIYDHDSVFFKNMIQNAYYFNNHEILLNYFDSSKDTWYNIDNRKLVREIL